MPTPLPTHRLKEIASLARKKHRDRLGQVLIEGVRSVEAAVAAQASLVEVLISETVFEEARMQALRKAAGESVYIVPERTLARCSEVRTSQGVLAVARRPLVSESALEGCATILALDGVQDPGNVGAVIRTAAWFGVEAILAGPGTADLFQPKVVRASMGGLWDVRLARSTDLRPTLARFQTQGYACYGADLRGTPVAAWRPTRPSLLVLGSEAHGLTPAVAELLTERIVIPGDAQRVGVESLNVAVAAGILVYAWMDDRGRPYE